MLNSTSSVSGSGYSLLIHSSILLSLAAASALSISPLPDPAPAHAPVPPFYTVMLGGGGGGGLPTPPPPLKGTPGKESQPPAVARPEEMPAPIAGAVSEPIAQPQDGEVAQPADSRAQDLTQDGGGPGDPGGSSSGAIGGIDGGTEGGGFGGEGSGPPGFGSGGSAPGSPGSGDTYYLDSTIIPPVLIRKVIPRYPEVARAARLEATLRFQIVVDESGDVSEVTPLKSHPLFEQDAIDAIREWKYHPATLKGTPVKVHLLVMVEFRLR